MNKAINLLYRKLQFLHSLYLSKIFFLAQPLIKNFPACSLAALSKRKAKDKLQKMLDGLLKSFLTFSSSKL
uniref:Uncharacterized protein n=1 Tax=Phlebia radiata TaxID=5308 RepID=L8B9G0_PHLRA|nr:hypothetical protein PRA_mt0197 [Phlebia radiata]CCE89256.1 hypothetical protein PRA_mt0197 [Phlebia radiata]